MLKELLNTAQVLELVRTIWPIMVDWTYSSVWLAFVSVFKIKACLQGQTQSRLEAWRVWTRNFWYAQVISRHLLI